MKTKIIKDKTFGTWFKLCYDCSEKEFVGFILKKYNFECKVTGAYGKSVILNDGENVFVWIDRKNNIETLSHEILHIVRFWLQEYLHLTMDEKTEEIYTSLHSFFMRRSLKDLGLGRYTAN